MTTPNIGKDQDLPRDNASRLAIYDAVCDYTNSMGVTGITEDDLFERVIARLRVLVPRELHLTGERPYMDEKIQACVDAGIMAWSVGDGPRLLLLTGQHPRVRYPDGIDRDYPAGLELARERLDRDNMALRSAGFDIRKFVPSIADEPDGEPFRALLDSMREHGFLKQFSIVKYEGDVIIDGRARLRAAVMLNMNVEYLKYASDKDRTAAHRRDTPLNRVTVAVHSNLGRLSPQAVSDAYESVSRVTRRPWSKTAADLELTAEWRRSTPAEYSPRFEVKRLAYRDRDDARVQVTPDGKVMLRSLIEAAGLSNYKIDLLRDFVPFERARSGHSAGRKAVFARAEDLITGIVAMQQDRTRGKRKLDAEWEQIHEWLVRTFGDTQG